MPRLERLGTVVGGTQVPFRRVCLDEISTPIVACGQGQCRWLVCEKINPCSKWMPLQTCAGRSPPGWCCASTRFTREDLQTLKRARHSDPVHCIKALPATQNACRKLDWAYGRNLGWGAWQNSSFCFIFQQNSSSLSYRYSSCCTG